MTDRSKSTKKQQEAQNLTTHNPDPDQIVIASHQPNLRTATMMFKSTFLLILALFATSFVAANNLRGLQNECQPGGSCSTPGVQCSSAYIGIPTGNLNGGGNKYMCHEPVTCSPTNFCTCEDAAADPDADPDADNGIWICYSYGLPGCQNNPPTGTYQPCVP